MSRVKKVFNIGDEFLSWVVTECVDPKKYRYRCRCSCGNERVFNKYKLLSGSFSICKQCDSFSPKNINLIAKHWNTDLNGLFTKTQVLNVNRLYWFICDKGHNFKSNIRNFSLDRCVSCRDKQDHHPTKLEAYQFAFELFSRVFSSVRKESDYWLIIDDLDTAIFFDEANRIGSYTLYYNNEDEFLKDVQHKMNTKREYAMLYERVLTVETHDSFKKNVDTLNNIMLELVESL